MRRGSARAFLLAAAAAATALLAPKAFATFSIVAYDSVTQEVGVAVQSRAFSVGMAVPWAEAGVGGIATQASTNESFGPMGLALLRQGKSAPEVLRALHIDLRVEDHTEPIRELRRVFQLLEAQKLAEAHLRYAEAYEKIGRKDLAKTERERVGEALRRALAGGVNDASSLNGLAWVCATSAIFLPEALTAAERAAAMEPKETGILDTLAEVHYRMGNAAKAIEVETKALALQPSDNYLKEQIARFKSGKQ